MDEQAFQTLPRKDRRSDSVIDCGRAYVDRLKADKRDSAKTARRCGTGSASPTTNH